MNKVFREVFFDGKNRLVSIEDLLKENKILQDKLSIAMDTLKNIKHIIDDFEDDPMNKITFMAYGNLWHVRDMSKQSLKQIKEVKKVTDEELAKQGDIEAFKRLIEQNKRYLSKRTCICIRC